MTKYMFYFFQILIMMWLVSLLKTTGQTVDNESSEATTINSSSNRWWFVIIHFIAWLFLFNHIIYEIKSKNRNNTEIGLQIILDFIDQNLNTLFGRTLAIFNFSAFNYLFPIGIILEIIFGMVILWCISKAEKPQTSKKFLQRIPFITLFKHIFNIINSEQKYLKYILISLLIFYFLNLLTSTIWHTMPGWILPISNILIMISSGVYFFRDNFDSRECEKLFGLTLSKSSL
jgi:hypothetical protein